MNRRSVLLTGAVAAALCLSLAVGAQAATRAAFLGAAGSAQVRPHEVALSADGTLEVEHTVWRSWGGATAVGDGTAEYHGCTPSCAAARPHTAPVVVRLTHPVSCPRGRDYLAGRYYDRVTLELRDGRTLDGAFLRHDNWAPCRTFDTR